MVTLPGMGGPGEYHCSCGQEGCHRHSPRFPSPITGHLTTVAGTFDIYGPMLGSPTWLTYPAGSDRKARRKLDTKRRKLDTKRRKLDTKRRKAAQKMLRRP